MAIQVLLAKRHEVSDDIAGLVKEHDMDAEDATPLQSHR
jgi:hypothetical protein